MSPNTTETELSTVRNDLQFIARQLQNGYLDFDVLDELTKVALGAARRLEEYKAKQSAQPVEAVAA